MKKVGPYERYFKRPMDLVLAFLALVVAAPIVAVIAMLLWAVMGRPILFKQPRVGRFNRVFTILKFRTMADEAGASPDTDSRRLTPLGRWLRRTSLDELPELINIIKGEMSLVGPRPLLVQYLSRYNAVQARRHEARPGLTGWAQTNGRNAISWEEKFKCDVFYVDNISALLDLRIICSTVWQVAQGHGINEIGQASAREFTGEAADVAQSNGIGVSNER